jgi:hypothetical protein
MCNEIHISIMQTGPLPEINPESYSPGVICGVTCKLIIYLFSVTGYYSAGMIYVWKFLHV